MDAGNIDPGIQADADAGIPFAQELVAEANASRPTLTDYDLFFWQAFRDLGTMRPPGYGSVTPIPYDAMIRWCEVNQVGSIERDQLLRIIPIVDAHFMNIHHARHTATPAK